MLRNTTLFSLCPDEFFHQWPGGGDTNGAWGVSGESAKMLWGEILASTCWQKTGSRGQHAVHDRKLNKVCRCYHSPGMVIYRKLIRVEHSLGHSSYEESERAGGLLGDGGYILRQNP